MNNVFLIGRLAREFELRYSQAGKAVANTAIAVESGFGDNKRTDFINLVAFGKLAEVVAQNLTKGSQVAITGELRINSYEDKQGNKKRAEQVVVSNVKFLDKKGKQQEQEVKGQEVSEDELPDELPF